MFVEAVLVHVLAADRIICFRFDVLSEVDSEWFS